jgi:DNA-nicking Smr family endonuclease
MSGSRKRADGAPGGRAPHDIAADDAALWQKVAATAKPLKPAKRAAAPKPKMKPREEPAVPKTPRAAPPPSAPATAPKPRALEAGAAVDLDRRTAERLKRGQLAIDGRIDLHGMTQDDAHAALARFVAASRARGRRCVLVITGKGRPGAEGGGVLKQAVPRWLNEPSLRAQILAFATAQPKDGGGGALYVLLKRVRP